MAVRRSSVLLLRPLSTHHHSMSLLLPGHEYIIHRLCPSSEWTHIILQWWRRRRGRLLFLVCGGGRLSRSILTYRYSHCAAASVFTLPVSCCEWLELVFVCGRCASVLLARLITKCSTYWGCISGGGGGCRWQQQQVNYCWRDSYMRKRVWQQQRQWEKHKLNRTLAMRFGTLYPQRFTGEAHLEDGRPQGTGERDCGVGIVCRRSRI